MTSDQQPIDAGDTVKHGPTGETWVVAVVRDDRLMPCGWPESLAEIQDCTLVEKATPEARTEMLRTWAEMRPDQGQTDLRTSYARQALADARAKGQT